MLLEDVLGEYFFRGCFGGCFWEDTSLRDVLGGCFGRMPLKDIVLKDAFLEYAFGGWETKWF